MGENGSFTIKNGKNADILDSSLLVWGGFGFLGFWVFFRTGFRLGVSLPFFLLYQIRKEPDQSGFCCLGLGFILLCCAVFGGERFLHGKRLRSYITGKVLFSVQDPAPCIEPIYVFPKILAGKLGAALFTSIPRCNPIASLKDQSLSPSAPEWEQFVSAEVFQELSLAETLKETQATYKTIAKSKFVRPEEGWRNHYTELRRFGLHPAAPSIYSSA